MQFYKFFYDKWKKENFFKLFGSWKKSLLAPAIELSEDYGRWSVVPSLVGFLLGAGFVWLSDLFLPQDTVKILTPRQGLNFKPYLFFMLFYKK